MYKLNITIIFILTLSGCFGGGAEVPQDNFYRLADVASAQKIDSPFNVVAVASFKSDALHQERAILYSEAAQPLNIQRYHYHHWTQVPNQLIQEHLIDYLREAGFATRIVRYGEVVKIDAKVSGFIKRFERVLDAGAVKVRVELELHIETLADKREYFQSTYSIEQKTSDSSMHASVVALSAALENIYQQFLSDIARKGMLKTG